jgi:hypothetical protein
MHPVGRAWAERDLNHFNIWRQMPEGDAKIEFRPLADRPPVSNYASRYPLHVCHLWHHQNLTPVEQYQAWIAATAHLFLPTVTQLGNSLTWMIMDYINPSTRVNVANKKRKRQWIEDQQEVWATNNKEARFNFLHPR